MSKKVYDIITNRIIEQLEQGEILWRKPWTCNQALPQNFTTKKPYRGLNVPLLGTSKYDCALWGTANQIKEKKGTIIPGSESSPLVYFAWVQGKKDPNRPNKKPDEYPMLRYYRVFNLLQTTGIEFPDPTVIEKFQPIDLCNRLIEQLRIPAVTHGFTSPSYDPFNDVIRMPAPDTFDTPESYYATLFHWMVVSTGHPNRLNRWKSAEKLNNDEFGHESLVAEFGSSFLCAMSGISKTLLINQVAYIQGWLKVLQSDSRVAVIAASQAHKAVDFLMTAFEKPEEPEAAEEKECEAG